MRTGSIPEAEEIDMSLLGSAMSMGYGQPKAHYSTVEEEEVPILSSMPFDVSSFTGPPQNEEQLREADRRKNEFLAILAHEVRNPLAPLRNGLQILKMRSSADPTVSQTVDMMDRQMTHLARLVDDLLDLSRITRGKLELRRQKVLLTEILANAVESSRALIEANRHELAVDLSVTDLLVDADPDRLVQVLSNLLLNSAKYTDAGGFITLALERDNGEAVVTVQDNGIGIPPAALEQIFDMFCQVPTHEARATQGLGIGLSVVRTLVEMHGGSVRAFSEGPGKGSRFTVRLPIAEGPHFVSEH